MVATVSTDLHTWSLRLRLRGDAFPVAGGSWTQISITILNAGHRAQEMAFTWPLAVAWCSDKDMPLLFRLWRPIFQVHPRSSIILFVF